MKSINLKSKKQININIFNIKYGYFLKNRPLLPINSKFFYNRLNFFNITIYHKIIFSTTIALHQSSLCFFAQTRCLYTHISMQRCSWLFYQLLLFPSPDLSLHLAMLRQHIQHTNPHCQCLLLYPLPSHYHYRPFQRWSPFQLVISLPTNLWLFYQFSTICCTQYKPLGHQDDFTEKFQGVRASRKHLQPSLQNPRRWNLEVLVF